MSSDFKPIEEVELNLVESFEDVQRFFRWLSEDRNRKFLGWDTETGGLEFWKQPLRLFQFGDVNTGWTFRADRWLGVAEQVFKEYEGLMTGQNVGFDVRFMGYQGGINVSWDRQYDTKIMAHILDPTKSTSLKALGARFLSPEAKRLQNSLDTAMRKQGWTWATVPVDFDIYWSYAALDPVLTARIAETFWPEIESNYLDVFTLESETARICSNMEMRGTPVDLKYCEEKYDAILKFTAEAERWCLENYGIRPGQNQEVALALKREGVDLSKTTASGDWAMDKDVLEGLEHPLAKTVLEHRKATKIGSTYFKNFLEMHNNGLLHPSINTLGARTGRMTVQNPAVQTLPRGRVVRDAFVAREGSSWLCVDFSNIEMKLLAHFSGDPGILKAARESDMHLEMARLAFQDTSIQKNDPRRQVMKNANFAKAYVAGVEKFAWTAGISFEDAQAFLDNYDVMFPGVKEFQSNVIKAVQQRASQEGKGWVRSPLGRKHIVERDKAYTAVNYLIQGTAAEAFKAGLIDLDHAGYGQFMMLPVHDEINLELPTAEAEDMQKEIQDILIRHDYSLPLTVEGSLGPNWGAAK